MVIAQRKNGSPSTVRITPAESRVLALLGTHLTLAAIGDRLGLTRATVKTHVAHVYKKLGVGTREAAMKRAEELGLLDAQEPPTSHRPENPLSKERGRDRGE